jgi:hypothetical protein
MKKGCAIAVGCSAALFLAFIGTCFYAAMEYEKEHPEMARAADTLLKVELQVMSFKGEAALGNNDEARALAKQYSVAMKAARQIFFTGSDKNKLSFTQGEFVTYCNLLPDRCAFIVHVPQLRNYTSDAETEMTEMAWRMAVNVLRDRSGFTKELAVGIRGPMNFGRILIGVPSSTGDNMAGIRERTTRSNALYPFFMAAADTPAPEKK